MNKSQDPLGYGRLDGKITGVDPASGPDYTVTAIHCTCGAVTSFQGEEIRKSYLCANCGRGYTFRGPFKARSS
jgi:hypothetical protein